MRRKVAILLAVPLLFMLSLFFLMSDIKHLPTENDELSIALPDTLEEVDTKGPGRQLRPAKEDTDVDIRPSEREDNKKPQQHAQEERSKVVPLPQNPQQQQLTPERNKDESKPQQQQPPPNTQALPESVVKPTEDDAPKPQNPDPEIQPLPTGKPNTAGGFGGGAPDGQQGMDEHNRATAEKHTDRPGELPTSSSNNEARRQAVKDAYLHAWRSYEKHVWGQDELRPISLQAQNWMGMGLSIVDSIDTMYIMGLTKEYEKARNWIENNLKFEYEVSFFETTIRIVGGLVSMFDLTGDKMYLNKAEELGKKMMNAFNSDSGFPYTSINLRTGQGQNPHWAMGSYILSEIGTVQMEYSTLSKRTGNPVYGEKALRVFDELDRMNKPDGLYPVYVTAHHTFQGGRVTLGALGDSFYEYLLKMFLLTNKKEPKYQRMYESAADAIINKLVKYSTPSNFAYIAEWENGGQVDKMDHLVCFAGAMFALGAYHNATSKVEEHMKLGKEITKTCHEFYKQQATGLGPEIVRFGSGRDFFIDHGAKHYILRPETVESYFVLYWITQDPIYQEWGWEAFQAIEKYCRKDTGYVGIRDVTITNPPVDDLQQSFFMAETLKYLYLLFSPRDTISLDEYVFNTEAHPIKIWK